MMCNSRGCAARLDESVYDAGAGEGARFDTPACIWWADGAGGEAIDGARGVPLHNPYYPWEHFRSTDEYAKLQPVWAALDAAAARLRSDPAGAVRGGGFGTAPLRTPNWDEWEWGDALEVRLTLSSHPTRGGVRGGEAEKGPSWRKQKVTLAALGEGGDALTARFAGAGPVVVVKMFDGEDGRMRYGGREAGEWVGFSMDEIHNDDWQWSLNADHTLSPLGSKEVVIGFDGSAAVLVAAGDARRAVFDLPTSIRPARRGAAERADQWGWDKESREFGQRFTPPEAATLAALLGR
eukprot:gene5879-7199_t